MKIRSDAYVLIVIMAIMLVVIGSSLRLEYFKPKILPMFIASITFILAGVALRKEILARGKPETTVTGGTTSSREESREGWRGYLVIGAWTVSFVLAVYLLSFIIAIPLFFLSYMKSHGIRWRVAITLAILIPVFIYSLFEIVLRIELYRGLLFS